MAVLETVPVADIQVPEQFVRLKDLAYNLWWSWNPRARRLFATINQSLWARYRNPVELLINIEPHHWEAISGESGAFNSDYRKIIREFDKYMGDPSTPFKTEFPDYKGGPVAYISTEFGIHESLGIYSGGLGVLSGDHAKAASDFGLPFIGLGILYRKGYFRQNIDPDGRQHHIFPNYDFYRLPLRPVHNQTTGRELLIGVELPGRTVHAKVWQLAVGRVKLYLLDTDIPDNDPADRPITSQLYVRGREMRLCQELVLGVGSVKVIKALGIEPRVWHMNEGHSGFMLLERLRDFTRQGFSWGEAVQAVKSTTMFTTHTPVPAGNEVFDMGMVAKYTGEYAKTMNVSNEQILDLGKSYPEGGGQPFNMTAFALRFARYSNGVSKLHGDVANQMWSHMFTHEEKQKDPAPIKAVTNGVHVATWLGHDIWNLIEEEIGPEWQKNLSNKDFWSKVRGLPDADLWAAHQHQKESLISLFRHRLVDQFARHGNSPDEMREVATMLDPNVLTIGFARRFATYKRAGLIFADFHRLCRIIKNAERPVHFIFSGKAHPADVPGQELVQQIVNIATRSELRGYVYFLEDYDMRIARHLVQGVDIWLNTPRRPREASGTSGMKAAMNGAMNLSISDGWWPEAYNGKNGWLISDGREFDNQDMQDYEDSVSFYEILEKQVVPLYYENRVKGLPVKWIEMMKDSIATITPAFSAFRMLEDYTRNAYMKS